jgi:hypothetical protein
MPGNKLPEWFSAETVSFSKRKNLELTSVVVGVIVSINHNIDIPIKREEMPGIIDVEASVFKLGKRIFNTTLNILGVPRTNVDHIHLCRFQNYHQLVAFLKDADTFCVTARNPPFDKGLKLKKCGVHLIFEGDDDYEGEEESLDVGLHSVSERLARFFNTCDEGVDVTYETESDDKFQHELEQEKEEHGIRLLSVKGNSILLFLLSVSFVLLSWFWLRCIPSAERRD